MDAWQWPTLLVTRPCRRFWAHPTSVLLFYLFFPQKSQLPYCPIISCNVKPCCISHERNFLYTAHVLQTPVVSWGAPILSSTQCKVNAKRIVSCYRLPSVFTPSVVQFVLSNPGTVFPSRLAALQTKTNLLPPFRALPNVCVTKRDHLQRPLLGNHARSLGHLPLAGVLGRKTCF